MKKIYFLLAMLCTVGGVWGQVTLPHLEPVNYATGGVGLQAQAGWTLLNSGDDLVISAGSLSYPGLPASTGNKVIFDAAGIDAAKAFTQQTSGTVYYSFLLNVTALGSLGTTGGYFTSLNEGTGTNFGATVWLRSDGAGYDIGINPRTTAANTVWSTGTTAINTTVMVVISYQIVSGTTNDVVKMWINPALGGAEPATTLTATNTGTDLLNLNRILIRQDNTGGTPFVQMDEMRIGTAWADVTPAGATPDVNISTPGIGASTENQGATNVVLQRFDIAPTLAGATINGLTVTTAGTYTATDLVNLKVRYSADATLDGADATLSTKATGLGAGSQVFTPFTSQAIAQDATGYIFITADIAATAVAGNTINVTSTPFTDISFAGTVNKTGTDPVAAGGVKTFAALAPSIAISSAAPAAASINQNSINNILYGLQLDVTSNNATLTDVTFTTGGTYQVADLQANSFKLWINSTNSLSGATQLGTGQAIVASGNTVSFTGLSSAISNGTTRYLLLTADVAFNATAGNIVNITSTPFTGIVFASGTKTGTDPVAAGNDQTIAAVTPAITITQTGPAASAVGNGATNAFLYQWNAAVTANTTILNAVSFTTAGTYISADLTANSFKLWHNSVNNFNTATQIGTSQPVVASGGTVSFTGLTQQINAGATGFFWLTVDVDANPTNGNTINITSTPFSAITFASGTLSGTDPMAAGGVRTIVIVPAAGEIVINQFNPGYAAAGDEYVELVNKTNKSFDLSALRIAYQSSTGGAGGAGGTLSGTIAPYSYWLLSPNATITVGLTSGLARDGAITGGFAATSGQLALQVVSTSANIDALGYGSLSGGTLSEGTAAASPSSNGGLKRNESDDTNNNSADFTAVANASIDLRNSSSRLAQPGSTITGATYSRLIVKGNTSVTASTTLTQRLELLNGTLTLGANNLVTPAVVGGSSTAYVVTDGAGTLTINNVGATNVLFPVGPSTSLYHPATINNAGTADNFSVRVSSTVPCIPAPSSVTATWDIAEGTAGGSNCTLSLDYTGAATGGLYTAVSAKIFHCNAGGEADYQNGSVTGTVATGAGFTSFSPFGISSDVVLLPISLPAFNGTKAGSVNNITWKANCYGAGTYTFELQRSNDGNQYKTVTVIAADEVRCQQPFAFADNSFNTNAVNYYRLKIIDIDGKVSYSRVISLINKTSGIALNSIMPSVVSDNAVLVISAAKGENINLVITDVNGRVVTQLNRRVVAGTNNIELNFNNLQAGIYLINGLTVTEKTPAIRFVKQ